MKRPARGTGIQQQVGSRRAARPADPEREPADPERDPELLSPAWLADVILAEQRARAFEAIRSLWRTGDAVLALRERVDDGAWRRAVAWCASRADLHPASIDAAARAAAAFRVEERSELIARFEAAGAHLMASHVIELARVAPTRRARGIDCLLRKPHSIRQLRACLRVGGCDGHRIGRR